MDTAWVAAFDLPLDELRSYSPDLREPRDLDTFWAETLADARSYDLAPTDQRIDVGLPLVEIHDLEFSGFGGHRVKAWLIRPAGRRDDDDALPCVVEAIGYGGGRGYPHEHLLWATAGFAHLVLDIRGQGSNGRHGDTPDPGVSGDPAFPGFVTRGIRDPYDYYYRRVYTDAVRLIDVARTLPGIDERRIVVRGGSQGGAISLAASVLDGDVAGVMPDVPFLCHFRRAVDITDEEPYTEITRYLRTRRDEVERVFDTLSYFDCAVLARRGTAPALFSVGLMDQTCPPSTVFAAYNAYGGPKEITVYPFNEHEGGGVDHFTAQRQFLDRVVGWP